MRVSLILIFFILCSGCDNDEPSLKSMVFGSYDGVINYYGGNPIPGDSQIERNAKVLVESNGLTTIKITLPSTTFIVTLERSFKSSDGHDILPFHFNRTEDEFTIECNSELNNWGNYCGYFNITTMHLYINFGWSNNESSGAGFVSVDKI